jgi:SHAQKYF class myb-like DNA-binding protein
MSDLSVCTSTSKSPRPESFIPPSVRIVVPSSTSISYDVPIVTPFDSLPDSGDNSITDSNQGKVGRWTEQEHTAFLEGLEKHGKQWKTIATMIGTRSVVQVRTHAQKYFQKMERKKNACSISLSSIDSSIDDSERSPLKRKSLPCGTSSSSVVKKAKALPETSTDECLTDVMEVQIFPQLIPSAEM